MHAAETGISDIWVLDGIFNEHKRLLLNQDIYHPQKAKYLRLHGCEMQGDVIFPATNSPRLEAREMRAGLSPSETSIYLATKVKLSMII